MEGFGGGGGVVWVWTFSPVKPFLVLSFSLRCVCLECSVTSVPEHVKTLTHHPGFVLAPPYMILMRIYHSYLQLSRTHSGHYIYFHSIPFSSPSEHINPPPLNVHSSWDARLQEEYHE